MHASVDNRQRVQDLYTVDQFAELLADAENNAGTEWEEEFVTDLTARFREYGRRMFLTDAQNDHLNRIAHGD